MYFQSAILFAATVLASAVSRTPLAFAPPIPRSDVEVVTPQRDLRTRSSSLMKRDATAHFDLGFEVKNQVLFNGPALNLGVPLKLKCVECRTWGQVETMMFIPSDIGDILKDLTDFDLFNEASMSIIFNGVGAFIDLSLSATEKGSFTVPLFTSETPAGVAGPNFQLGVVFFVDLAIGIIGEIEANSGFQLTIPDGSSFTMPLDPKVANTADFDGTMFSLLPLTFDAAVNVTVALRLRVQAGIEFVGSPLLSAKALAGAYLNIPEIILGETLSLGGGNASCNLAALAEINLNAGVFVDVGADIGKIELGDFNPTLSTTFLQADITTCFDDIIGGGGGGGGYATASAVPYPNATMTVPAPAPACPTDLVTETITTASMVTLTRCALPVINCPADMTQVFMAEQTETITSSSCPVEVAQLWRNGTDMTTILTTVTTTVYNTAPTAPAPRGAVYLMQLPTPITSELVIDPAVTPPAEPTVTCTVGGGEVESASGAMAHVTARAKPYF